MRELKFRARAKCIYNWSGYNRVSRVNDGDWVYGHYFTEPSCNEDRLAFDFVPHIRTPYGDHSADIEIDPETLGQYIGHKNKNGVEIYEGDIVQFGKAVGFITWESGGFAFVEDRDSRFFTPFFRLVRANATEDAEVIGNIYENPELLED